jgi:hypothetical protein
VSAAKGVRADTPPPPSIPAEGPAEHVRNALAILRARLEQGPAAGDLALDLGAVVARLERAVEALDGRGTPTPRVTLAATGHPVRAKVELTRATSCVWLADAWGNGSSPPVAELVAHWQSCTRCHADAAGATARVTRRSWVP